MARRQMNDSGSARCLQPGEEERLTALFEAVYGPDWQARTSIDRYLGKDGWPASVSVVESDGILVGAQPTYDVPCLVGGTETTLSVLIDVVTHPAYRRRGVFSEVLDHAAAECAARGSALALTTPNEAAHRVFAGKSDWLLLTVPECRVRFLRPDAILVQCYRFPRSIAGVLGASFLAVVGGRRSRSGPGITEMQGAPPGDEFDALWRRCAPSIRVAQRRDGRWFRWRFGCPGPEARYHLLADRKEGALAGYAVTTLRTVAGVSVTLLVDSFCPREAESTRAELADAVTEWSQSAGAAAIVTYTVPGDPWSKTLARRAFWRLPGFLASRPYRVYARIPDRTASRHVLIEPGAWHMTLADSDLA